jgi:hypothetical protein
VDREMKKSILVGVDYGITQIVGGMILIAIAVVVFSAIYSYVFPLPLPPPEPNVKLTGYVDDFGYAVIKHESGEPIILYKINIENSDGVLLSSTIYDDSSDPWKIGECKYPSILSPLINENESVKISIYSLEGEGEEQIFNGVLRGKIDYESECGEAMLISSLRTDTVEEDIAVINNYPYLWPDVNVSSYIFKWLLNGVSLAKVILPFDTENSSSTKDYSDSNYNVTVFDADWTDNGIVGGAYHYNGASDYISLDLPDIFYDLSNNDFTICLWLMSEDINDDWRLAVMGSVNNKNFIKLFQYGTEIHFGIAEDGTKRAVRTENLSSNTWYHIAVVWDASEKSISLFKDGVYVNHSGNRNFAMGASTGKLELGHGSASSRFWLGYIDEFEVYDRTLTKEQIYQIYLSTKDGDFYERVIVSEETIIGDIWQCIIFPNDSIQDITSIDSNIINIVNYTGG